MKFLLSTILSVFIMHVFGQETAVKDSALLPKYEDKAIEEVITSKKPPKEEKVQYISQVTRYGFKGLFNGRDYSYTPGLSYSAQISPYAEVFMDNYIRRHGRFLLNMKGWGQPYFNLIESIFSQYGVPHELKYLAVIESNLSPASTSWVGAAGPWQFMPYTGREFGLVVSQGYDERRDYYKSTHAAAKYLLQLYKQMNHDWLLVIAAYNGGPGRVFSAINRSGSRNFWDLQYYLPEESRNHVKKFIATHYIMEGGQGSGSFAGTNVVTGEGMDEYTNSTVYAIPRGGNKDYYAINKPILTEEEAARIEVAGVSGKYRSSVIARNLQMDIKEFNRLNPNFDITLANIGNYDLRLPIEKMQLFKATRYDILNECVQELLNSNVNYSTETIYKKKVKYKKGS